MGRRKWRRVDPTHEWEQIELLCAWEEQREYERIRPLVLFGEPVSERSAETGASERTLYRRVAAFGEHGMESLFASPKAKRRVLPPATRRKIVDRARPSARPSTRPSTWKRSPTSAGSSWEGGPTATP
jgi:hypothetical protein